MRRLMMVLLVPALVACSPLQESKDKDLTTEVAYAPAADAAAAPAADAAAAEGGASEPSTAPRIAAGPPMLAYSYAYGISLPSGQVDELRRRHEALCVKAGYRVCQVVSTSISENGDDNVQGELVLRAAPAWLKSFREGLTQEARRAGGKVLRSEVTSEDLSREIVDTSAQLKAKLVLRDRLQALLAGRPGRLADLLAVERELARVQGEVDSTQSQLAVMQARVAMSEVTLSYGSMGVLATAGPWSPLAQSVNDFLAIVAESLAGLVRLIAWLAPWAVIGGGLLWVFRRRLPKLRWPFRAKAPPA